MRPSLVRALVPALAAILAAGALSLDAPARGGAELPTKRKGVLTVALALGTPGFAEGTAAKPRGFSVDVATAVAKRMGLGVTFLDYPFQELFVPGPKPYDVAFEYVTILPGRKRFVDFSTPQIASTQGVLVARDVTGPVTLARLRTLQICVKPFTTGDAYVRRVLQPQGLVLEYPTADQALRALSSSTCDAFVFDLPVLVVARQHSPTRYGEIAGRVGQTEYYGAVLPKGSALLAPVNKAIRALRGNGTMRKIELRHFGVNFFSTPLIR